MKRINQTNRDDGFTLLEMIIVVAILSILFLLTVPNIQTTLGIVNRKGDAARLKVVDSAIVQYRLEYNENPSDISDLISEGLLTEEQAECSDGKMISIYDGQATLQ